MLHIEIQDNQLKLTDATDTVVIKEPSRVNREVDASYTLTVLHNILTKGSFNHHIRHKDFNGKALPIDYTFTDEHSVEVCEDIISDEIATITLSDEELFDYYNLEVIITFGNVNLLSQMLSRGN
jgi:hypothetical protein